MPTWTWPSRARCSAGSGRRPACTSLGTAIVHEGVHDDLVARFAKAVEDGLIGDLTADVLYGPMLNSRFCDRFLDEWLRSFDRTTRCTASERHRRITAANPRAGFVGDPEDGLYVHPTIVDGVTIDDELYRTETFGPDRRRRDVRNARRGDRARERHGYGLRARSTRATR